jgi:hypothetical protein
MKSSEKVMNFLKENRNAHSMNDNYAVYNQ